MTAPAVERKAPKAAGVLLFSCTRSALAEALAKLSPIVAGKLSLPVLGHALIESDADGVTLTASDIDRAVIARMAAVTTVRAQPLCLPIKRLSDIVATIAPAATLTFTARSSNSHEVTLTAGRSRFTMMAMSADEFPRVQRPNADGKTLVAATLDGKLLVEGMKRVVPHCSSEQSRPTVNGICIDAWSDGFDLFATDGSRGMRVRLATEPPFHGEFILPQTAVPLLVKLFADDDAVAFAADSYRVSFAGKAGELVARLIEGPYPNYRQLLTDKSTRSARLAGWELLAALRRVTALSAHGERVEFTWSEHEVTLTSDHQDAGRAVDTIAAQYTGPSGEDIGVTGYRHAANGKFLRDIIESVGGEEVELRMKGPNDIVFLRDPAKKDAPTASDLGLCMPLRLLPGGTTEPATDTSDATETTEGTD